MTCWGDWCLPAETTSVNVSLLKLPRPFRAYGHEMSSLEANPTPDTPDATHIAFEKELDRQIAFQERWRTLSMSAYVVTTVGTLICSAGATYIAAGGAPAHFAAILSAAATVFVGTEKALLFREKWKFHLAVVTKLKLLKTRMSLRLTPGEEAASQFAEIMTLYASELPMAGRSDGQ